MLSTNFMYFNINQFYKLYTIHYTRDLCHEWPMDLKTSHPDNAVAHVGTNQFVKTHRIGLKHVLW